MNSGHLTSPHLAVAQVCFETLLQYSLLAESPPLTNGNTEVVEGVAAMAVGEASVTNRLAVTSLLHRWFSATATTTTTAAPRFKEVVTRYIADEALQGAVPLPSHRVSEMSFVLKAVATLISR